MTKQQRYYIIRIAIFITIIALFYSYPVEFVQYSACALGGALVLLVGFGIYNTFKRLG